MTFSRIKPVGWQVNEKVTSPQLNQLDLDHSKAVDKTGDNLTNGGGITGRVDVISGGTFQIQTGAILYVQTGGSIQVLNSGEQVFAGSSQCTFDNTSVLEMNDTSNLIIGGTASFLSAGTNNITSGGTLGINSGATMHVKSGATATIDASGILALAGASAVNASSGANVNMNAGSNMTFTNSFLTLTGASTLGIVAAGATLILSNGGGSFLTVGTGNTINIHGTFKSDSWATWNTPQTRALIESTTSGIGIAGTWSGGLQFVYSGAVGSAWAQQLQRTHNNSNLAQLFVGLSVGQSHSAVPAVRPSLSVVRYSWTGMFSPQTLSTTDPQYFPNPGSGSAYYASGAQQFMNYVCNQNNLIDNTQYIYVLLITDESGSNSLTLNAYGLIYLEYQVIPDQSWNI